MEALEKEGLLENTLVVFFSDNGGIANISSQYPARAGKGSYYEGGIREPMIMSWPARFKAGKVIDEPVSGLDFYPTFMEAAGVKQTNNLVLDGESLLSLIVKDKKLKREALFWHFPIYLEAIHPVKDQARDPLFRTRPGSVIRKGKWKLHEYFEDGALELYNLEEDPGETNNLAAQMPEKVTELHQLLKEWRQAMWAPVPTMINPWFKAQ